jgi:hypothetical protein
MLKATLLTIGLLSLTSTVSVQAQSRGGGDSPGIPLGSGGSQSDGNKNDNGQKPNAMERPVSGVVTDGDGKPIVGAMVQLKNTRTLKVISAITREKGEFQFLALNKDVDYEITAVFQDHSVSHTLSMFDPRMKPVVNLRIK